MSDGTPVPVGDLRTRVDEVKRNRPPEDMAERMGHEHGLETVREDDYRGHHVVIRTTYQIEVDGRPVTGHLGVSQDGRVHYHAIPNLSFDSAIELVRRLIDAFPEEFPGGDAHPADARR
jgi:hypothetical protein